jgi:hypothetical protein
LILVLNNRASFGAVVGDPAPGTIVSAEMNRAVVGS